MKSEPGSAMRTGLTGTPLTWSRSRVAHSYHSNRYDIIIIDDEPLRASLAWSSVNSIWTAVSLTLALALNETDFNSRERIEEKMATPILVTGAAGRVGAVGRTITELLLKQG